MLMLDEEVYCLFEGRIGRGRIVAKGPRKDQEGFCSLVHVKNEPDDLWRWCGDAELEGVQAHILEVGSDDDILNSPHVLGTAIIAIVTVGTELWEKQMARVIQPVISIS